eukprot:656789-Rhodomonas_salina.1
MANGGSAFDQTGIRVADLQLDSDVTVSTLPLSAVPEELEGYSELLHEYLPAEEDIKATHPVCDVPVQKKTAQVQREQLENLPVYSGMMMQHGMICRDVRHVAAKG